jgi:hypothetical protein
MSTILRRAMIGSMSFRAPAEVVDMGLAKQALSVITPETNLTAEQLNERKDRINGIFKSAEEQTKDGTQTDDTLRKTAEREAKAIWQDFAGKGGVWELHLKTRDKLASIASHIHAIAKACCKAAIARAEEDEQADVGKLAGNFFRNAIAVAELEIRRIANPQTDEHFDMLDSFFSSTWKTYKSRTQGVIGKGFDANDFEGLGEFMQANAAPQSQQGNPDGGPGAPSRTEAQIKTAIMDTAEAVAKDTGKVQGAITQLLIALKASDTVKHEDRIVQILEMCTREVKKLPGKPEGVKTMAGRAVPAVKTAEA